MFSRPLIRYVLLAAARDRLVATFAALILCAAALSVFLGSTGLTEKDAFALVFGASGLRFLGVLGLTLFSAFYIRRSFETKEVEFFLSRPLSRVQFLGSHAAAFAALALVITLLEVAAVFLIGRPALDGLFVWGLSIFAENLIVITVSMFFSMVLTSASASAMGTLGFYVLCRMIGTLIGIAAQPTEKIFFIVLNNLMEVISMIVPRLDMMGQTGWLVYGVEGSGGIGFLPGATGFAETLAAHAGITGFILIEALLFTGLYFTAAAFDFLRRQF